jgi:hypothetical protein
MATVLPLLLEVLFLHNSKNQQNKEKTILLPTMMTNKIASEIFFLLLLLLLTRSTSSSNAAIVVEDDNNIDTTSKNPLVRFFSKQYNKIVLQQSNAKSSLTGGLLRRQLLLGDVNNDGNINDSNKIKERFGPGSDFSCTKKGANYDSCVQEQEKGADDDAASSCAWCPLGSTTGICLRTDQAELVNGLKNDLLHLKCYNNNIEQEQLHTDIETGTKFWDETIACHSHNSNNCAGSHGDNANENHICTWCTVNKPEMGMCVSQNLWDNLVVAQALEEFDNDVSTNDQIRIDQVIHCVDGDNEKKKESLSDTTTWTCGSLLVKTDKDKDVCLSSKDGDDGSCVVQSNPFPGLMGYVAGEYCMSHQQQRFILWIVELLRDMGWEKEMSSYV